MVKVKEYLDYLERDWNTSLFRQECKTGFDNIRSQFGEMETEETIQEVHLAKPEKECDYSIRMEVKDSKYLKEYWLELDDRACAVSPVKPCYFVDASAVKPGQDNNWFYEKILPELASGKTKKNLNKLIYMLDECVQKLEGKCKCLFQLGVMSGRGEKNIRLFTDYMKKEDITEWLKNLSWSGNTQILAELLSGLESYVEDQNFIVDFDVNENGISGKIGINFGTKDKKTDTVRSFLEYLQSRGLCLPEKKKGVMEWIQRYPSHTPFIQNDISHFKIPFSGEEALDAKAYLRQGSVPYVPVRVLESPYIMNLELTEKCPLSCPQCYCELEKGRELSLEKARYWIEEAALNHVNTINLSGGETMCYPHIYELVKYISSRNMEANIAISGAYFTEEVLEKFTESGIGDICVSLNAPTEDVNKLTRDGYSLALNALEILRQAQFPRTCINWVMHRNNADFLPQMLKLAEKYKVRDFAVMVFKPDAKKERNSLPTLEQIKKAAAFIKQYRGSVHIEAESCFSQLRALLGQKFFINTNRGISKGCGAGRDALSVNVEGKLTPCRHLEIAEDYQDIQSYWKDSMVLKKLRTVEEEQRTPCRNCRFHLYCIPCMAVNYKMNGEIYMGEEACELWNKE